MQLVLILSLISAVVRGAVTVTGRALRVDGQPYHIKGVCYSPVPVGESPDFPPFGDYFTPEYAYLWARDFPLLKSLGANTIRIYGWSTDVDHTQFLDEAHAHGLKVFVTFFVGTVKDNPVSTEQQRQTLVQAFARQVKYYGNHPALLLWGFGNEMNGEWNKFKRDLSDSFDCQWTPACEYHTSTDQQCYFAMGCVYTHLFTLINDACQEAKKYSSVPCTSGMADIDYLVGSGRDMVDKVQRFDGLLPSMDVWSVQLYRGDSFGGYFGQYGPESSKPLLVTEYGVDAYNDPCGWDEYSHNNGSVCFNTVHDGNGGADIPANPEDFVGCESHGSCKIPGAQAQAEWNTKMTREIMDQYNDPAVQPHAPGEGSKVVAGGFVMAWADENWKSAHVQSWCRKPCGTTPEEIEVCQNEDKDKYKLGGSKGCVEKAHITCANHNASYQDLCGYKLHSAPDKYVNEGWFGITTPSAACPALHYHHMDSLKLRLTFRELQGLWGGSVMAPQTCEDMEPCFSCLVQQFPLEYSDGDGWQWDCASCKSVCLKSQCSASHIPAVVDYCANEPCAFGDCVNGAAGFLCICPQGFTGTRCETAHYNGASCSTAQNCMAGSLCNQTKCVCDNIDAAHCAPNGAHCSEEQGPGRCLSGFCSEGFCACPTGAEAVGITCLDNGQRCQADVFCKSGSCVLNGAYRYCRCSLVSESFAACAANGAPCPAGPSGVGCTSGFCSAGICCATDCTGPCTHCRAKAGIPPGTCQNELSGTDPEADCGTCAQCNGNGACVRSSAGSTGSAMSPGGYSSGQVCEENKSPPEECGLDGKCDGQGKCRYHSTTTPCREQSCGDGLLTTAATCSGSGECPLAQAVCGNGLSNCASEVECADTCAPGIHDSEECIVGAYCSLDSECALYLKHATPCVSGFQCASAFCANDLCCDTACDGECQTCSLGATVGVCEQVANGTDPHGRCGAQSVCNTNATCVKLTGEECELSSECLSRLCFKNHCYIDADDCAPQPCVHAEECVDAIGNYTCICLPGYQGLRCELEIDECLVEPCMNDAECVDAIANFTCVCKPGYDGRLCEHEVDECLNGPCLHNGTCVDLVNDYRCDCAPGFTDKDCQTEVDECAPVPCKHAGTCTDLLNDFRCDCVRGWEGKTCDIETDNCADPFPCLNDGVCTSSVGNFTCKCPREFQGEVCAEPVSPAPQSKGHAMVITLVVVLVAILLLCGGVGYACFRRRTPSDEKFQLLAADGTSVQTGNPAGHAPVLFGSGVKVPANGDTSIQTELR